MGVEGKGKLCSNDAFRKLLYSLREKGSGAGEKTLRKGGGGLEKAVATPTI